MNMMKRIAALCVALMLCVSAVCMAEADDPVIVRVDDVVYTRSEVQNYWENIAQSIVGMGATISDEELLQYEQSVIDSYVTMGIIEKKYVEFGLDQSSFSSDTELETLTDEYYRTMENYFAKNIANQYDIPLEEAKEYAPMFMKLNRYTRDTARNQALTQLKQDKLVAYVTEDVEPLSDVELKVYYEDNCLKPSRQAYQDDIAAYENDVLFLNSVSYYVPADYRLIRHIYLWPTEETAARLEALLDEIKAAQEAVQVANNKIYGAKLLEEDTTEAEAELVEAEAALEALNAEWDAVYNSGLTEHADTIAEIQSRIDAGEDFETLIAEYNEDPDQPEEGFRVCAKSVLWDDNFRDASMALKEIGEISGPVATQGGVHFLCYVGDIAKGDVPLEGAMKERITKMANADKKLSVLYGFVRQWKSEYDVFTDVSLLEKPMCLN